MEALAALSLAANVMQFVEFGQKLVAKSSELRSSASGALSVNVELQSLATDLGNKKRDLITMASSCSALAEEFSTLLKKLDVQNRKKKWESVCKAFKTILNENTIRDYRQRLENYRGQIMLRLVGMLSQQHSNINKKLDKLLLMQRDLQTEQRNDLRKLKNDILTTSEQGAASIPDDTTIALLKKSINSLISQACDLERMFQIFKSLEFESISYRFDSIPEAESGSFEWIWGSQRENYSGHDGDPKFKEWLDSSHGLYWITGKPGSGKSTLMKYLSTSKRVRRPFRERTTLTADFYFWAAGTREQKTQEGLLRTLLYHILRQIPEFIQQIVPGRWGDSHSYIRSSSWNLLELQEAFKRLSFLDLDKMSKRLLLFIDGLDEYEGDHENLVKIINDMTSANIKICCSSRPWVVFEAAYGANFGYRLAIHEYTLPDIRQFIRVRLEEDHRFIELRKHDDEGCIALIEEISMKAQGVFLWVYLVVRSLRRGLLNADTVEELFRRVNMMPSDLHGFFQHMLTSIDEAYQEHAAQIYLMCLQGPSPLSLVPISFYGHKDQHFAVKLDLHKAERIFLDDNGKLAVERLKARCPDLLDVIPHKSPKWGSSHRVEFLHKTARDFLRSEDIMRSLMRSAGMFDPTCQLCQGYIVETRLLQKATFAPFGKVKDVDYRDSFVRFMYHCSSLMKRNPVLAGNYIDYFHQVVFAGGNDMCLFRSFLHVAIDLGYTEYLRHCMINVQSCIYDESTNPGSIEPLLVRALNKDNEFYDYRPPHRSLEDTLDLDLDIISVLLEAGSSPNLISQFDLQVENRTISAWGHLIKRIIYSSRPQQTARAMELFINHGADLDDRFFAKHLDMPEASVSQFIERFFDHPETERLHEAVRQRRNYERFSQTHTITQKRNPNKRSRDPDEEEQLPLRTKIKQDESNAPD